MTWAQLYRVARLNSGYVCIEFEKTSGVAVILQDSSLEMLMKSKTINQQIGR